MSWFSLVAANGWEVLDQSREKYICTRPAFINHGKWETSWRYSPACHQKRCSKGKGFAPRCCRIESHRRSAKAGMGYQRANPSGPLTNYIPSNPDLSVDLAKPSSGSGTDIFSPMLPSVAGGSILLEDPAAFGSVMAMIAAVKARSPARVCSMYSSGIFRSY